MAKRISLTFWLGFLLVLSFGSHAAENVPPLGTRSSSAITITADGATLLVVNPDSNSLTLVDVASHSARAEVPVGVDPRSVAVSPDGSAAYVADQGSDRLSPPGSS